MPGRPIPIVVQLMAGAAVGFAGAFGFAAARPLLRSMPSVSDVASAMEAKGVLPNVLNPHCTIKGNISVDGERIYHMPGQRYYDVTAINPVFGERWFCSESEARAAGWRKSKV
jgi:hypothetical protein